MGFNGINDFINSLFGIKHTDINVIVVFITTLTSIITNYMWNDAAAVYTLWILMAADWGTGIWKSMKIKKFESNKLFRMPLFFTSTSAVISFSWWISKTSIVFALLPSIAMGGFLSVYFISLLENLGELDLLPKNMVKVLKSRFGLKALMDKIDNHEHKIEQ